jgi:DoxX-like protein
MSTTVLPRKSHLNLWLWIVQAVLAVLFLFTGGSKLAMPMQVLAQQSHLPGAFMKFIGVCEVLGALGLVLPGLTHIRPVLTPLAAALLVIIMIGATVSTAILLPSLLALPAVVLVLTAFVAYGRWRLAPLDGAPRALSLGA